MAGEDLSAVSLDELQKEFVESAHALAALSDRRMLLNAEIQSRQTMAAARSRMQTMSAPEKEALRQVLNDDAKADGAADAVPAEEVKR